MSRPSATALAVLSALLPVVVATSAAGDHTPANDDGLQWKNAAGADFNLEIAWTTGYTAQGAAYLDRVHDLADQDPSCHAGTCSATSWSHWYQHRAQPYFGGAESTVADFDPRSGTPASRCGTEGRVSFHWLKPATLPTPLGETYRCPYDASDPTRVYSSQVIVNPSPPAPGSLDAAFYTCPPGPYTWHDEDERVALGPGEAGDCGDPDAVRARAQATVNDRRLQLDADHPAQLAAAHTVAVLHPGQQHVGHGSPSF